LVVGVDVVGTGVAGWLQNVPLAYVQLFDIGKGYSEKAPQHFYESDSKGVSIGSRLVPPHRTAVPNASEVSVKAFEDVSYFSKPNEGLF
jgi:hypothetical protein